MKNRLAILLILLSIAVIRLDAHASFFSKLGEDEFEKLRSAILDGNVKCTFPEPGDHLTCEPDLVASFLFVGTIPKYKSKKGLELTYVAKLSLLESRKLKTKTEKKIYGCGKLAGSRLRVEETSKISHTREYYYYHDEVEFPKYGKECTVKASSKKRGCSVSSCITLGDKNHFLKVMGDRITPWITPGENISPEDVEYNKKQLKKLWRILGKYRKITASVLNRKKIVKKKKIKKPVTAKLWKMQVETIESAVITATDPDNIFNINCSKNICNLEFPVHENLLKQTLEFSIKSKIPYYLDSSKKLSMEQLSKREYLFIRPKMRKTKYSSYSDFVKNVCGLENVGDISTAYLDFAKYPVVGWKGIVFNTEDNLVDQVKNKNSLLKSVNIMCFARRRKQMAVKLSIDSSILPKLASGDIVMFHGIPEKFDQHAGGCLSPPNSSTMMKLTNGFIELRKKAVDTAKNKKKMRSQTLFITESTGVETGATYGGGTNEVETSPDPYGAPPPPGTPGNVPIPPPNTPAKTHGGTGDASSLTGNQGDSTTPDALVPDAARQY